MKKRLIYISISVIVILLGYFNYFAEDKEIGGSNQVVETTNVKYKNEDYTVEAKKQLDYIKDKETAFESARAKVNDMFLSGDNVFIDKVRNLALKHNILGISTNGWKFKAEEANYNKLKDEVTSNTGVMAENEEKGIKISGQNFMTNSKMSYINLDDNVVLENKQIALRGDKGRYDDISKIINLSDNITLEGRGENEGQIDGHFKNMKYNMEQKTLEAWEAFDMTYKGMKLSAEKLFAKDDTKEIKITKNVKIKAQGFDIKVRGIRKTPGSEIVVLEGPIVGDDGKYSFTATKGEYNTTTKIFDLEKIRGKSIENETLVAERLIYDSNTKIATMIAKKNIEYTSKDGKLLTSKLIYNLDTKKAKTSSSYTFNGPKYASKGELLEYDEVTKDVKITKGYLEDKLKKERLSGDKLDYNLDTKDTNITGNVMVENPNYTMKTSYFTYDGKKEIADVPNPYEVKFGKDGAKFKGGSAVYTKATNKFVSSGDIVGQDGNYLFKGEDLEYDSSTGLGKLNSKVLIENKVDNVKISGDNLSFEKDKNITLDGNLKLETQKFIAKSQIAKYNIVDKKIYIDKKVDFVSKDGVSKGVMKDGVYSTETSTFTGNKFVGTSQGNKIVSDELRYETKTDDLTFVGDYTIYYDNLVFKGEDGVFNNKTKKLNGKKSIITTGAGDEFISDTVSGDLNEMILDFDGNIRGRMDDNGKTAYFSGEHTRVYFKKLQKYELYRSEITKDAVFTEGNKTLKSNYIELDLIRNLIFAKDDTQIILSDPKSGKSVATADVIEVDTTTNIATLTGNVKLNNQDSIIRADRGIYNMNTKKLKALGDVYINYKK